MKKLFISLIVVAFALSVSNLQAQIRIGAKGGFNVTKVNQDGVDYNSKLGVQLGIVGEYEILDGLSAHSGLLVTTKGGRYSYGIYDTKISLTYLDIPLHAIYKYDLGSLAVYGKGGLDIFAGLTGKFKYDGDSESIEWGSDDDSYLKRLELGFHLEGGVELMEKLQLGMSFNFGLNDISASGNNDIHNNVFAITATYFFAEL
jgi:hypothetical protein